MRISCWQLQVQCVRSRESNMTEFPTRYQNCVVKAIFTFYHTQQLVGQHLHYFVYKHAYSQNMQCVIPWQYQLWRDYHAPSWKPYIHTYLVLYLSTVSGHCWINWSEWSHCVTYHHKYVHDVKWLTATDTFCLAKGVPKHWFLTDVCGYSHHTTLLPRLLTMDDNTKTTLDTLKPCNQLFWKSPSVHEFGQYRYHKMSQDLLQMHAMEPAHKGTEWESVCSEELCFLLICTQVWEQITNEFDRKEVYTKPSAIHVENVTVHWGKALTIFKVSDHIPSFLLAKMDCST